MKTHSNYININTSDLLATFKKGDVLFTREYNIWSLFDFIFTNEGVFHTCLITEKNNQLYLLHSHCASIFNPNYVISEYTYCGSTWRVFEEPLLEYVLVNEKSVYHIFRHDSPKNILITNKMIKKANCYCSHLIGTIFYENKLFTLEEKGKGLVVSFHPDKIIQRLYQIGYKSLFVRQV